MKSRSFFSGPRTENRGSKPLTLENPFPNRGIKLPGLISHSFVPRLVRIVTTLVENRPYSAANGFASSSTEPRLCPGSSKSKSPDEGSMRLALLI